MRRRARTVHNGVEFHFFYEKADHSATRLHITAAHGTSVADAIQTYFGGVTSYDEEHRRFVTANDIHTLYWNWLDEQARIVYIITCMKTGE